MHSRGRDDTMPDIMLGLQIVKTLLAIRFFGRRIPVFCEWEITRRCNMACECCSTRFEDRDAGGDISTADALRVIDDIAGCGVRMLHFSGGEPTLRDDLPELIARAQGRGIIVSLTTNGSASESRMEKIARADLIRVSIDGTEAFHDRRRNFPGAFQRATATLRFLRSLGKKPLMATTYMKNSSYGMIEELCVLAREIGVQITLNIQGRNVNAGPLNAKGGSVNDLADPVFAGFFDAVGRARKKFGTVVANPEPLLSVLKKGGLDRYGCRAMDAAIALKHDGSVSMPCNGLMLQKVYGVAPSAAFYGKEALRIRPMQGKHAACRGCYIKCMASASGILKVRGCAAIIDGYMRSVM